MLTTGATGGEAQIRAAKSGRHWEAGPHRLGRTRATRLAVCLGRHLSGTRRLQVERGHVHGYCVGIRTRRGDPPSRMARVHRIDSTANPGAGSTRSCARSSIPTSSERTPMTRPSPPLDADQVQRGADAVQDLLALIERAEAVEFSRQRSRAPEAVIHDRVMGQAPRAPMSAEFVHGLAGAGSIPPEMSHRGSALTGRARMLSTA